MVLAHKHSKGIRSKRKLRIATGNISGLCSERKQKAVGKLLLKIQLDVVAGQESWERWFGKPCSDKKSQMGEGRVGFLVHE